jgi:hypothetical protein
MIERLQKMSLPVALVLVALIAGIVCTLIFVDADRLAWVLGPEAIGGAITMYLLNKSKKPVGEKPEASE